MSIHYKKIMFFILLFMPAVIVYAAIPFDVKHMKQNVSTNQIGFKEISRILDAQHTLHLRVQETYAGYPIVGADAVLHIPHANNTMMQLTDVIGMLGKSTAIDGALYQGLYAELGQPPALILSDGQKQKIYQQTMAAYQKQIHHDVAIKNRKSNLMVYVDKNHQAHWVYYITFHAQAVNSRSLPAKPVYLADAFSATIYEHWDQIQAYHLENALGGGFGGNEKMGQLIYDGSTSHLPGLHLQHDTDAMRCYLSNHDVLVEKCVEYDGAYNMCLRSMLFSTPCQLHPLHNNTYWTGDTDAVNGGYSPSNDVLFNGSIIKEFYLQWYHLQVLIDENKNPLQLDMVVHLPLDNAYWDDEEKKMYFGDGIDFFYPLTHLTIAAHEISHGFTAQHSRLVYAGQSGGMNESFSDMAAAAAMFYAYNTTPNQIGKEIVKMPESMGCKEEQNCALRYLDQPSKDCYGKEPGDDCSVDEVKQYHAGLDVHYSSGIYNRAFYLLSTSPNWDVKKAFAVMAKANEIYWTSRTTFVKGACGVIKAARDYQYDENAVKAAFQAVGINTSSCRS